MNERIQELAREAGPASSVVLDYPVIIKMDKHEFDKHWMFKKTWDTTTWLYENVGQTDLLNTPPECIAWSQNLDYEGLDIVLTFRFRRPTDSLLFAIRWL